MPTTGGALAFAGFVPPYEATLDDEPARRRRDHHRQDRHDRARQLGGRRADADADQLQRARRLRLQPLRSAPRSAAATVDGRPVLATGGSSSGIGTAASFWAANVGTETSGSILSPANQNMLVGIKPTVGRISRYGVIPITADQDTPGPMAQNGERTPRSCSACSKARRPIRTIRRRSTLHAAAGARLHAVPARDGCAARASASRARSTTTRHAARRRRRRAAASIADQAKVMAEAIAVLQSAGRRHRRSGRHPERGRSRIRSSNFLRCGASARARTTRAARTPTARSCSSTG